MDDHHNDNDPWVPPPHDEMDLDGEEEDDEDDDSEDEDDDEEDVDDDEVLAIPNALGLQNLAMFDGGIADDDEAEETKPRGKATDGEIVRASCRVLYLQRPATFLQTYPSPHNRRFISSAPTRFCLITRFLKAELLYKLA